jgi:hypothetical protein
MSDAASLCARVLGPTAFDSVRLLLESCRLQIRFATRAGYAVAGRLATDASLRLDVLSRRDPAGAARLASLCATLVGVSRLLQSGELSASNAEALAVAETEDAELREAERKAAVKAAALDVANSVLGPLGGKVLY